MRKAVSTHVHIRQRLHTGILDTLATGGIEALELFAHRSHFDYTDPRQVRELASWLNAQGNIAFHSMHAPMYASGEWGRFDCAPLDIAGRERRERIEAMDEIKRAIEVAETVAFRYLILHPGVYGAPSDEAQFEAAMSSVEHLRAFAAPLGVRLLLENIPNELSAPGRLMELIASLHYEDLGVCLDLGHAHLGVGVAEAVATVSSRLRSVHVHDNQGLKDEHLWPGEGSIDWIPTMELLQAAPLVPTLVMEISGHPEGDPAFGKIVPERLRAAWQKLGL